MVNIRKHASEQSAILLNLPSGAGALPIHDLFSATRTNSKMKESVERKHWAIAG